MRKFLAVVRHEYKKIVFKWTFLIASLLFPVIGSMFAIVPALIFSIKSEATRIVIVDGSGKIAPRLRNNLVKESRPASDKQPSLQPLDETKKPSETFLFVDYDAAGKTREKILEELNDKVAAGQLDAYLLIPQNFEDPAAEFDLFSRKSGDFVTISIFEEALNDAVRSQRLADADISEARLKNLTQNINLDKKGLDKTGAVKDSDSGFIAAFIIGLMIYITLAIYGQSIMAAVVEEKETRIAEILFSSARPFVLMLGKLVGVALAGLTQLAIWIISVAVFAGLGASSFGAAGIPVSFPEITPVMIILFFIFFLLGFFLYASIFALIGSVVTTVQEGGQFAFPPIMILLLGFYFSFIVIRDPNSAVSFWVSIAPFFAPITMPVRIIAETPPVWQIALSIFINLLAIVGMVALASRVYRIGMLMYGKRATIPEIFKWIRS